MTEPDTLLPNRQRRCRTNRLTANEQLFAETEQMRRWMTYRFGRGSRDIEQAVAAEVWAAICDGFTDEVELRRAADRAVHRARRWEQRNRRRDGRWQLVEGVGGVDRVADFADSVVAALDAQTAVWQLAASTRFPIEEMTRWADQKAGVVDDGPMPIGLRRTASRWASRARTALEGVDHAA